MVGKRGCTPGHPELCVNSKAETLRALSLHSALADSEILGKFGHRLTENTYKKEILQHLSIVFYISMLRILLPVGAPWLFSFLYCLTGSVFADPMVHL